MIEHITTVVYDGNCWNQSGCTCGWMGPRRTMAQISLADALDHKATQLRIEAQTFKAGLKARNATITMGDEDCPVHTHDLRGEER